MRQLRYTGGFASRAGTRWRADIMQEADAPYAAPGALTFPADEPLVIEWKREDRETVILGSSATLRIISPGDRTYEDLYSIEPGLIRLDVYRDTLLYWSGTLDPEFYEEPYETARGYEVSLTFSDFGILGRLRYCLDGLRTLREIIEDALSRAGILYGDISTDLVSTRLADGGGLAGDALSALSVRSDNFTDEEGETCTLEEAVEGVLQPLAARMVQRSGTVCLYDINGLYTSGERRAIRWDGGSQTMGTDKVANNVTVSFSPYSSSTLISGDIEYGGRYDVEHTNLTNSAPSDGEFGDYYSYYPDYGAHYNGGWDYDLIDFTIFLSGSADGLAAAGPGCRYFHLLPVTGGAPECSGVAYAFRTGGHGSLKSGRPKWILHNGVPHAGSGMVLTTERAFLPRLEPSDAARYRIRVVEEALIDARYNPFCSGGDAVDNEEGNDTRLKTCSGFVFMPARITLYGASGDALYHYSNRKAAEGATLGHLSAARGEWLRGADPGGDCWLEYYSPDNPGEDAGVRGWKGNRHCIGRPDGKGGRRDNVMADSFKSIDDGEYLPYPPEGGWLEIRIDEGLLGYDYGQDADDCAFGSTDSQWDRKDIYAHMRWLLYKAPRVEVVNSNLALDKAELEDVEYAGYLNRSAKDDIEIETICGTADRTCPTAKGCYFGTSGGTQIKELSRAGVTDHPEKLLLGTLYSQYAGRLTLLSGEAVIDGGLHAYTEANQPGRVFMLTEDVQDLITDCTDAEYGEIRPDEYEGVEEKE